MTIVKTVYLFLAPYLPEHLPIYVSKTDSIRLRIDVR